MSSPPTLPIALADQNPRFQGAFNLLEGGIAERAFSAFSLAVTHRGQMVALKSVGNVSFDTQSRGVTATTMFDIASLTKVVATTMAMVLWERGKLSLDATVGALLPAFLTSDKRREQVTVRHLLAHTSGLPAYAPLFETCKNAQEIIQAATTMPLSHAPGEHAEYSDIGFVLLGQILRMAAEEPLSAFFYRDIFQPLGMRHTMYCPSLDLRPLIPATEDDNTFRKRLIQGEVHDENAFVLGGIAAHAGLFATAYDLALLAECMLRGGSPLARAGTLAEFTRRQDGPPGTTRGLGWDTPSPPSQSGQHFGPRSYGHLGYTGCSLWIDPDRLLSVTLLTNRTLAGRESQQIKELRPQVHDAVVDAL